MPPSTSTLCQGLQSCLDPLLFEPRVSTHQASPPKHGLTFPWPEKQPETEPEAPIHQETTPKNSTTWNFLQSLPNKLADDECGPQQVYVHPLSRASSLSSKSLEMCTESLGSETGSDIDADAFSRLFLERACSDKAAKAPKKVKHSCSFPPPLTSISQGDGVQVRTHREDGRLVIKAFSLSKSRACFRAERGNGRLRLSLMRDFCNNEEEEVIDETEEVQEVDQVEGQDVEDEEIFDQAEEEEEEEGNGGELNGGFWGGGLRDDGGKMGWKMDGGDWSSNRWCNGDRSTGKRLTSLPYCVAIS